MTDKNRLRIFMTGVGGQGTLTATNLLARVALDMGLEVSAGEIHGMAQRAGGGWNPPYSSAVGKVRSSLTARPTF